MGCMLVSEYSQVYSTSKFKYLHKWKSQFDAMGMTESEIGRLLKTFRGIDTNDSGKIDSLELLMV
jgi:hypothetical protein